MVWRGPRTPTDPLLATTAWRTTIRQYWIRQHLPCARCGRAIDYEGPRYVVMAGRRRLNPRYLVVGHKVSRAIAKRTGWTEQQINALTNTQPECNHCSVTSGARDGQRAQAKRMAAKRMATITRW